MAGRLSPLAYARRALLGWYDENARDLPWRRTRDPYAIWVSEIMLQQTRVDTVVPYYTRFLARFPDVERLAEAHEDEVLSHWSGLGYYRRARLLHRGAKHVAEVHAGQVPRDAVARRKLPGVGRYTAGAIGSIAFELPEPIVDGNVARVLSRYLGIDTPLGKRETEARLWAEAEAIAAGDRPGALNQALMELGALVCTPKGARCEACPLRARCVALSTSRVESLPVVPAKKAPKAVALVAIVPRADDDALWLVRSQTALFGGLWGVPVVEGEGRASALALLSAHGLRGRVEDEARGSVRHVLTHRALSVRVFVASAVSGRAASGLRKVFAAELLELGVSKLTSKILALSAA
jgi:A/G-specific adenine glycosylase